MHIDRKTKQIKTVISKREAIRLERVRKRYLFKSDYEFVTACVTVCLNALDNEGIDEGVKSLPDELRVWFGEVLYRSMIDNKCGSTQSLLFDDYYCQDEDKCSERRAKHTDNIATTPPREWVEKFIAKYYEELYAKWAGQAEVLCTDDGFTAIDIFQDMILRLYRQKTIFDNYEDWEQNALSKFNKL